MNRRTTSRHASRGTECARKTSQIAINRAASGLSGSTAQAARVRASSNGTHRTLIGNANVNADQEMPAKMGRPSTLLNTKARAAFPMAVFGHIQLEAYCKNDMVLSRKLLRWPGPFFRGHFRQIRRSTRRAGATTTSRSTSRGREHDRRCFPDRVAIALTGDGAMEMNGLNACVTVAKYWKEWADLPGPQ
jgi:hypothetical protein